MAGHSGAVDGVRRVSDLASMLVGIAPGSRLAALRAERAAIRDHGQGAFEQLVTPTDPGGVSLVERAALALRVALLEGDDALAARFHALLTPIATPAEAQAAQTFPAPELPDRFSLLLRYADLVAATPERCGQADIDALTAHGLSAQDIVAVTQLVSFVPYQVRLHAGLAALRDEMSA